MNIERRITCLSLNTNRRTNSEIDKLIYLMNQYKVDVMMLQETNTLSPKTKAKLQTVYEIDIHEHKVTDMARGVTTLISKDIKQYVTNTGTLDENGRSILIEITIDSHKINILNIYAPNYPLERKNFFSALLPNIPTANTIMGGDYNCVTELNLDCLRDANVRNAYTGTCPEILQNFMQTYHFRDIWRELNPAKRRYTFCTPGGTRARLDKFLITPEFNTNTITSKIIPIAYSDHDAVTLSVTFTVTKYKKSAWKLNNSLLLDPNICNDFVQIWRDWQGEKLYTDPHQWWETGKQKARKFFQLRGANKAKMQKTRESHLRTNLERLCDVVDPPENMVADIAAVQHELAEIESLHIQGLKIRARIQDAEEGEKSTAYFYKRHQQNIAKKNIKSLKDEHGTPQVGEQKLEIVYKHFRQLYESESEHISDNEIVTYLLPVESAVNHNVQDEIGGFITCDEALAALNKMAANKSPGPDGLTKEFYCKFWDTLGQDLVDMLNNSYRNKHLPPTTRVAQISLLFKKGDPELIQNWRPISLLNIDYKILSKTLTERIKPILPQIIDKHQACGIKGRSIHDHLLLIHHMIEHVENNGAHRGGVTLLSADQKQAFDRQEHKYVWKCLEKYGFGPKLIRWIQTLYDGANSYCSINGENTKSIYLKRSMRQGCGLSMLLFMISLEPFLVNIQKNANIFGFRNTDGKKVKLIAYADDISFFTNGGQELNEIFTEFERYGKISGATLNMAKTEILQIGNHRPNKITNEYQVYIKQQVKILGLIFSRQGYTETNYKNIIEKIRKKADWWKTRQVSLYGKALVINSILLSQLWFAARILTNMSAKTKQTIVQIIFQFLWFPQKIESVKRTTLALPQIQGGLGILDLTTRLQAYKLERFSLIKQTEEIKPWMPLFGYKYDFFLRKHLEIRHLSLTHQEKLKPKDKDLITIYTKYIQANTNTNWNNLKLKQIYLNLIAKQTPPITVKKKEI